MSTKEQHNETTDTAAEETLEQTAEQTESEFADQNEAGENAGEDARYVELTKQAEENQQRYLRAQADFDNFRRRTMKEKEELAQYASMKLIDQLVPIVDNFERALAAASSNSDYDSLAKGIDMIFRQLFQTLEAEGLKAIEAVGQPFNPEFHQAIMTVESDEYEEGIVVEEVQKGYMLKEKVLRPAMVKVSG
ncbi:nucleotide exchange factor GrpE [Paenibacillus agaridevorans]|uniref:Protein GrpE n=1 Tax=Paenibacillus agaridevorans TaxID=171404 RepID=A0A2R5F258_9BACL|nr:nucleotide exchange factor GrpE [Paenibacillus agaridevorans]GBG12209.1 nucleotide exchange factor GrpE [Paenibacillus agaridevorans]